MHATFKDPITLSYIEKNRKYREKIINEACPRAVLRQKGISLRDYSGTILFEEEKTRLYYALRSLQDYYKEGRIYQERLSRLPSNLIVLIEGDRDMLLRLYNEARYTIIDQYKRDSFDSIKWRDLLELIKLGHYDLREKEILEALEYYNERTNLKKYSSIDEVEHETGEAIQKRLTDRLMYMKPSSFQKVHLEAKVGV